MGVRSENLLRNYKVLIDTVLYNLFSLRTIRLAIT